MPLKIVDGLNSLARRKTTLVSGVALRGFNTPPRNLSILRLDINSPARLRYPKHWRARSIVSEGTALAVDLL